MWKQQCMVININLFLASDGSQVLFTFKKISYGGIYHNHWTILCTKILMFCKFLVINITYKEKSDVKVEPASMTAASYTQRLQAFIICVKILSGYIHYHCNFND